MMRYEDWTFRGTEIRLSEHSDLRRALELEEVPDHTTLFRFFERLEEKVIEEALCEIVRRMGKKSKRRRRIIAIDGSGLSPGSISSFFIRRKEEHGNKPIARNYWLKWLIAVDVDSQLLVAQMAHRGPVNDCANLRPLIDQAAKSVSIGSVLADAEFDSERNHEHVRSKYHAESIIPAKRGAKHWKIHGFRAQMRSTFPTKKYRKRALIESVFSAIKRKLSCRAPGRSILNQRKQALLLGLSYNLYRLWCLFFPKKSFFSYLTLLPISFSTKLSYFKNP